MRDTGLGVLQTVDTLYIIDSSDEDEYTLEEMYAGLLVMMESWEIAAARGSREERGRLLMMVQQQLSKIGVTQASAPVLNMTAAQVTALAGRNIPQVAAAAGAQLAPQQVQGEAAGAQVYSPGLLGTYTGANSSMQGAAAGAQGYTPSLPGYYPGLSSSLAAAAAAVHGYSMGLPGNTGGATASSAGAGRASNIPLVGYSTPQPTLSAPGMQFIPTGTPSGGFALVQQQPTDPRRRYVVEGGRSSEVQWAAPTAAPAAAVPRPHPAAPSHG